MTTTETTRPLFELAEQAQDLLFRDARTAYAFTDEPVTAEQLEAIYDLAKWGPTGMNQQPLRIVAVKSGDMRERLVETMTGSNQARTRNAPLTLVLGADHDFHEHLPTMFPKAPTAKDMYAGDDETRANSARLNAALQIGYLITATRALGLAAGPMAGFDNAAVDDLFFDGSNVHSLVVMNLGRPGNDAFYQRGPRFEPDAVIRTV